MTQNRSKSLSTMSTRQKITAVIFVLILLIVLWQVIGLFSGGGGSNEPAPTPATPTRSGTMSATSPTGAPQPPQAIPQSAPIQRQVALSPREAELLRLQQETEAKYLAAINDLQMLRVERDIAETNKAIMSAKLDTITAEKNIVDLLKPPTPPVTPSTYAQGLVNPLPSGNTVAPAQLQIQNVPSQAAPPAQISPPPTPDINYTVISVAQLQNKWNAVVGYQGSLFNVNVGDFLPPDQSRVVSIDRSGVVLEKNGVKKKVSLVPII